MKYTNNLARENYNSGCMNMFGNKMKIYFAFTLNSLLSPVSSSPSFRISKIKLENAFLDKWEPHSILSCSPTRSLSVVYSADNLIIAYSHYSLFSRYSYYRTTGLLLSVVLMYSSSSSLSCSKHSFGLT